jgi:hypothetical protein
MYGRIVALTGNPFFPFLPKLFGPTPWTLTTPPIASHVTAALRLFWNITFARQHVNYQPPYSPLFAVSMLITLLAATRDRRATFIATMCIVYIGVFTFLPQDSRYLLPLLPLVAMTAASTITPFLRRKSIIAISLLAVAPGFAYAGYCFVRQGPLPLTPTPTQRQHYLEAHIPEYRALEHRGPGRIYVACAEQLKYFGGEDLLGDVAGPFANDTILALSSEQLWQTLTRSQIRYLLISRAHCPAAWQRLPSEPRFELVYADDGAALWRLRP